MKKTTCFIILTYILLAILSFFFGQALDVSSTYQSPAIVIETDEQNGWVTLMDWNGEAWCIRNDSFAMNELVIATFNDNGTETIYDDMIVEVQRGIYNQTE